MSEENVEIVRRLLDMFNAFICGELTEEAAADLLDSEIEVHWHDRRTYPDLPQHLRGAPEGIGLWEQLRSAWADLVWEPLEFIEGPGDRVLTPTRLSGRGRESGVPIEVHFFSVCTIRDGNVRSFEIFRHHADALEAAGLRE
jgi:ketosteroid isomerase-like protein